MATIDMSITTDSIQTDPSTLDSIDKILLDNFDKPLSDEIKGNVKILRAAASHYIAIVEDLNKKVEEFENLLRHQQNLRRGNQSNFNTLEEYIRGKDQVRAFLNSEIPKKLYEESMNFQQILNNFLGQKVTMVFVFENIDGEPELYEITSEDVLKYDYSSSNKLVARYRGDADALNHSMKQLQLTADWNFNLSGLKSTYVETLYRYRCSRQINKRIVLWQNPYNEWHAMKISAEGDINEAYASIVILNRKEPSFNSNNMEINIEQFLNEVAQVDNISGLLQGDVTNGNIEYGIKSAGASTFSLKQIIKIAYQIVNDENFSQEKLEKIKAKFAAKGRTRNKEWKSIEKSVIEAVTKIMDTNR